MTDDLAVRRAQVAADRELLGATLRQLAGRFDVPARAHAGLRSAGRRVARSSYLVPAVLTVAAAAVLVLARRSR